MNALCRITLWKIAAHWMLFHWLGLSQWNSWIHCQSWCHIRSCRSVFSSCAIPTLCCHTPTWGYNTPSGWLNTIRLVLRFLPIRELIKVNVCMHRNIPDLFSWPGFTICLYTFPTHGHSIIALFTSPWPIQIINGIHIMRSTRNII